MSASSAPETAEAGGEPGRRGDESDRTLLLLDMACRAVLLAWLIVGVANHRPSRDFADIRWVLATYASWQVVMLLIETQWLRHRGSWYEGQRRAIIVGAAASARLLWLLPVALAAGVHAPWFLAGAIATFAVVGSSIQRARRPHP